MTSDGQLPTDRILSTDDVPICDPLLAYISFAMNSATGDNIKKAVLGYFTPDTIFNARDNLWDVCPIDVIGVRKRRNDLSTRSDKCSNNR